MANEYVRLKHPDDCRDCERHLRCCESSPCLYSWQDFAEDPEDTETIVAGVGAAIMRGDAWLALDRPEGFEIIVRARGVNDHPSNFVDQRTSDLSNPCVHLQPTCSFFDSDKQPLGGAVYGKQEDGLCHFPPAIEELGSSPENPLSWARYQKGFRELAVKLANMSYKDYPYCWDE
jgi:hypothetical protein